MGRQNTQQKIGDLMHLDIRLTKNEKPIHNNNCAYWHNKPYQDLTKPYYHHFGEKHRTGHWPTKKDITRGYDEPTDYEYYRMVACNKKRLESCNKRLHGLEDSCYDILPYRDYSDNDLNGMVLVESNPDGNTLEGPPIIAFACRGRLYLSETFLFKIKDMKPANLRDNAVSVDASDPTLWEVLKELGLYKNETYLSLLLNIAQDVTIPNVVTNLIREYADFTDAK